MRLSDEVALAEVVLCCFINQAIMAAAVVEVGVQAIQMVAAEAAAVEVGVLVRL